MSSATNEYGLFWNAVGGDREYDADSFELWLKKFFTSGVFNGDLQVTSSSGMSISVGTGYVNTNGKPKFFETATEITIDPPNSRYPRIDTIVVRRDNEARDITIEKVTGAYSGDTPVATPPTRNATIFELVLAQVNVEAGATEITQADITDTRMQSDICGWVTGAVEQITYEQILEQFNSFLDNFESNTMADFEEFAKESDAEMKEWYLKTMEDINTWYDSIKDRISEADAARLQLQIDELKSVIDTSYYTFKLQTDSGEYIRVNPGDGHILGTDAFVKLSSLNQVVADLKQYMHDNYQEK